MRKKDTAYNRQVLRYSNIWQTPYTTKSKLQFLSLEHTRHPRPLQMNEDSLVDVGRQSGKHSVCMLYDVDVCFNLCCLNLFESVWICLMFFQCVWHLFVVFSFALWFCVSRRALSGLSGARMKFEWHPGNAKRCKWPDSLQSVQRCWSTLTVHI